LLALIISLGLLIFWGSLRGATILSLLFLLVRNIPWTKVFEFGLAFEKLTWAIGILTAILLVYCISAKSKDFELWLLTLVCITFFITNRAILFYFRYEAILLPVVWLLLKAGREPERLTSSIYIVGYTFVGTLPMLIIGLSLMKSEGTERLRLLILSGISGWGFLVITLTFLVKLPIWGVHRWLPLAHVYSPLVGSIILAGILLKAGAYGIHLTLCLVDGRCWSVFLVSSIGILGAILCFYSGTKEADLKSIIAFRSIIHIGVCVPILRFGSLSRLSALLAILVGHGLARPILFRVATSLGSSFNTRMLFFVKGLPTIRFAIIALTAVALSFNAGFPPRLNFIAELLGLLRCWGLGTPILLIFGCVFLAGGLYGIFIWIMVQQSTGKIGKVVNPNWKDVWGLSLLALMRVSWCLFILPKKAGE